MNLVEQAVILTQEEDTCLYQVSRRYKNLTNNKINNLTILVSFLTFHKDVIPLDFEEIISLPNEKFKEQVESAVSYTLRNRTN